MSDGEHDEEQDLCRPSAWVVLWTGLFSEAGVLIMTVLAVVAITIWGRP